MAKRRTVTAVTSTNTPDENGLFDESRMKALESTLNDLTKRYGEGTVVRLGDAAHMQVDVISTGSLTTDIALGVGGLPRGRIVEIYGPESSGKTTFCLHVIREAQSHGGLCAFVDMEHALEPRYASSIGVDIERLYVSQPDTGEQALEITESLVRSGALDVIVIDSVAALVPRAEIEGEMGDSHVGLQARLMSQALRKLTGAIKQSNVILIFTNQIREKVGVMFGCFSYDARVMLADGSLEAIGEIVNQQRPVEVMSYNEATDCFEPKSVVGWFKNGEDVEKFSLTDNEIAKAQQVFLTIRTEYPDETGATEFTCTPNHTILTPLGYQMAQDLQPGDTIITRAPLTMPEGVVAYEATEVVITEICPEIYMGERAVRYNLEVADNHNFLVGNAIVHNSPETTSGGRALKFYASIRLDIRKVLAIKQGGEIIGSRVHIKVKKNKVAAPFKESEFDLMFYEGGISKVGEIVDLAAEANIIEKRGAFYRYKDELLGQGRENTKQYLAEHPEISHAVELEIRAFYSSNNPMPIKPSRGGNDDDSGGGDE